MLIWMATIKKKNNRCWRGWEKLEPLCAVGESVKWHSHVGSGMVPPPKVKYRITTWSHNFASGLHPKEVNVRPRTDICTLTFTAALIAIAK